MINYFGEDSIIGEFFNPIGEDSITEDLLNPMGENAFVGADSIMGNLDD